MNERHHDMFWTVLVKDGLAYARPFGMSAAQMQKQKNEVPFWLLPLIKSMCYGPTWPDVELIWRVGGRAANTPLTLSWSKAYNQSDLLVPSASSTSLSALRSGATFMHVPWAQRKPVALWQGASSMRAPGMPNGDTKRQHQTRGKLLSICSNHTDLCDAQLPQHTVYTTPGADSTNTSETSPMSLAAVMRDAASHKYALLIDGSPAATHTLPVLFSGSVLVRQMSPSVEFYYSALQPYVHYMPVAPDLSDLPAVLRWLRAHDKEAQAMAARTLAWAMAHVTEEAVGCHVAALVHGLAQRIQWQPNATEAYKEWRIAPDRATRKQINADVGFMCM
uniref:Glycosyl transferase CAP10 domain-containing protein n=1 Tax=Chlamydomonas leiostraca TaxID=1034604 RepID=A0A7S0S4H2_9CHLO